MIYALGTSHATIFREKEVLDYKFSDEGELSPSGRFRVWAIKPYLAYNMGDPKHEGYKEALRLVQQLKQTSNVVVLCFGEVDCRNHFIKQSVYQDRKLSDVIKEAAKNYFYNFVLDVASLKIKVAILSAEPQREVPNPDFVKYPEAAFVGSAKMRNTAVKIWNDYMGEFCDVNLSQDIKFISIFDELIDENMVVKEEYMLDQVHLNQKALPLIVDKMKQQGLI